METKRIFSVGETEVLIRPYKPGDSLEEITVLLHTSYKKLADMGLKYLASHQDIARTRARVEAGLCWIGIKEDRIVATITYYDPEHTDGSPWYNKPNVAHFGQFAVLPELQGHGFGDYLIRLVEEYAFYTGVEELALDTSEKANHLVSYYQKRGYRFVEYIQWDVTNYRSVILSKHLSDFYGPKAGEGQG